MVILVLCVSTTVYYVCVPLFVMMLITGVWKRIYRRLEMIRYIFGERKNGVWNVQWRGDYNQCVEGC